MKQTETGPQNDTDVLTKTAPKIIVPQKQPVILPQYTPTFIPQFQAQYAQPLKQSTILPPVQGQGMQYIAPKPMARSWVERIPYQSKYCILESYTDYVPINITDYVPCQRVYNDYSEIQHTVDYAPVTRYQLQIRYEKRVDYVPVESYDQYVDYTPYESSLVTKPYDQNVPLIPKPQSYVQPQFTNPNIYNPYIHQMYNQHYMHAPVWQHPVQTHLIHPHVHNPVWQAPVQTHFVQPPVIPQHNSLQQTRIFYNKDIPVQLNDLYTNPYMTPYGYHQYRY